MLNKFLRIVARSQPAISPENMKAAITLQRFAPDIQGAIRRIIENLEPAEAQSAAQREHQKPIITIDRDDRPGA